MTISNRFGLLAAVVVFGSVSLAEGKSGEDCLYSFSVGSAQTQVAACGYEDPKRIGDDARIRQTIDALGIPASAVTFRGCAGQPFSAGADVRHTGESDKYIVTYPADLQSPLTAMVAPIIHELAHVAQIRRARGLANLRKSFESRRIELGADFIAGLVFKKVIVNTDLKDFLLNLSLIGSYRARDVASHGTPEQRSDSFRLGAFAKYPYDELSILNSEHYFQENDYARVVGN